MCAIALRDGFMPAGIPASMADPALGLNYLTSSRRQDLRRVMSNSFGFGGTNCTLVFGRGA